MAEEPVPPAETQTNKVMEAGRAPATNIAPVFLSMSLVAGLISFRQSPQTIPHWIVFGYFVLNRIRYFYGSSPWDRLAARCSREGLRFERSIGLIFMISNLFLGVVVGTYVNDIQYYLLFSSINLSIGTLYLVYERIALLDREKDTGKIKLFTIQKDWMWINAIEGFFFVAAAIAYWLEDDIKSLSPKLAPLNIKDLAIYIPFTVLAIIVLFDWVIHHEFLFTQE